MRRIIIDSDAKNEADDQYAIVHALLTPSFDIRGIIPAHFGTERTDISRDLSRQEVDLLLELMDLSGRVRVENGAPHRLPDEATAVDSPGARLIIEEAHRDAGTLYVCFLGPLTDMASAVLLDPSIADSDLVVVWIGGPPYGDKVPMYWPEFNLRNDVAAANVVFGSGLRVWQVPMSTYAMIATSQAELEEKVAPYGAIGEYLVRQLVEFQSQGGHGAELEAMLPLEGRSLGDTPAIGLVLSPYSAEWRDQPPVRINAEYRYEPSERGRTIRVAERVDGRYFLEDFFAKIKRFGTTGS